MIIYKNNVINDIKNDVIYVNELVIYRNNVKVSILILNKKIIKK